MSCELGLSDEWVICAIMQYDHVEILPQYIQWMEILYGKFLPIRSVRTLENALFCCVHFSVFPTLTHRIQLIHWTRILPDVIGPRLVEMETGVSLTPPASPLSQDTSTLSHKHLQWHQESRVCAVFPSRQLTPELPLEVPDECEGGEQERVGRRSEWITVTAYHNTQSSSSVLFSYKLWHGNPPKAVIHEPHIRSVSLRLIITQWRFPESTC